MLYFGIPRKWTRSEIRSHPVVSMQGGRYPSQSPQPKLRVNILRTEILEPTIKSLCMAESRFRTVADAVGDCIHSHRASRCPVPGAQYGILSAWILFLLSCPKNLRKACPSPPTKFTRK